MDERDFDNLIRAAFESEQLDDPAAPAQRTAACLSMGRLAALTDATLPPTEREQRHLARCAICHLRYRAFAAARTVPSEFIPAGGSHRFSPWALRLTAAAAAACLMLFTYLAQPEASRSGRAARTSLAGFEPPAPMSVSVCHEPSPVAEDSRRIDHFKTTSDAACVIVAVFRTWDEACQCLDWQLHEWDETGHTLAELEPDDLVEIALDVTGNPPVGQLLVLATSRSPDDLPTTPDDAAALLQCLNEVAPPTCSDGGVRSFASAVGECLPSSVMLVEETFFVD